MKSSRRDFLKGASVTAGAAALAGGAHGGPESGQRGLQVLPADGDVTLDLRVNGEVQRVVTRADATLATVLRERAGLTGTKVSCETGACGACTILVDGRPTPSCLQLALDAEGRNVRTVEGLAEGERLHPVQRAFVEADALQCGFCTPGFVMASVAFYEEWRAAGRAGEPARADVERALAGNLCRCGAQPQLIEAVQAACAGRPARAAAGAQPPHVVGRVDAVDKVTGRARYAVDVYPERVLHGAFLRADVAHAKVARVDVEPARRMPGVRAVTVLLPMVDGKPGRIRWVGQALAAVGADTLAQAEAAARAIVVEKKVLPAAIRWRDALASDAPRVWEEPAKAPSAAERLGVPEFLFEWDGNRRKQLVWPLGSNHDGALPHAKRAEVFKELEVETESQFHVPLERHACVAEWDGGELTLHTGTQTVQMLAKDIADRMEVSHANVQVLSPYVGGGFGSKTGARPEHLAAAQLARDAGRPVRIVVDPRTHFTDGGNRPGTHHRIAIGAQRDGGLVALSHRGIAACGVATGERATLLSDKHYAFAHKYQEDHNVTTHTSPGRAWRAPGWPPGAFALEQLVDEVAVELDDDPLVFRAKREERRRVRMLYRAARARSGYGDRLKQVGDGRGRFVRGVGVATAEYMTFTQPTCRVELRAFRDGHVEISTATHELGQGVRSVLANVVADLLRLPGDRVHVRVGDSRLGAFFGTFGSLTTQTVAPAAMRACLELKDELARAALRSRPGAEREDRGVRTSDNSLVPWRDLFGELPEDPWSTTALRGVDEGGFAFPPPILGPLAAASPVAFGKDVPSSAYVTEVEVDRRLGRVRVLRSFVMLDAGRVVSPVTAASQVVGAVMQGVSFALFEERRLDRRDGRDLTAGFDDYQILGVADAPEVAVDFLAADSPHNPYGALGLGENALIACAASVGNAVFRATGRRVLHTPMTLARVLGALA